MAKEVLTEERHKNDHHHHEESCGCGHDHHHEDTCGCGHNHHHEDACGCGHEHHHEEHKEADHTFDHAEKQVYILENLGCAHCASKMEEKIQALKESIPELPNVKLQRYVFDFDLSQTDATLIAEDISRSKMFDACVALGTCKPKSISNWILADIAGWIYYKKLQQR